MKHTAALAALLLLLAASSFAQFTPQYPPAKTATPAPTPVAAPAAAPVATSAAPSSGGAEMSSLLSQVNRASQATLQDLAGLRIEKWKTDGPSKEQLQQQSTALQRNLAAALPELMAQVRTHPDDLAASFKLYRNLNALYDVLVPLAEASGRVGPQSDYDSLARDASAFDGARRAFADRLESLAAARDAELTKLRSQIQAAAAPPPTTTKTVIDDKPTKTSRKKTTKKASTSKPTATPQPQ
jgi:hypothetical protein